MDFKTGQQIHHQKRSFGAGTKADRPTVTASAKKSFLFNPFIAGVVHSSLHSRAWLALSLGMGILGATIGHLPAYAEGSYQIGVSDGNDPSEQSRGSIRQAIFEYDSPFNNPGTTGLTPAINRPIFVDVLAGGNHSLPPPTEIPGTLDFWFRGRGGYERLHLDRPVSIL